MEDWSGLQQFLLQGYGMREPSLSYGREPVPICLPELPSSRTPTYKQQIIGSRMEIQGPNNEVQ